MYNPQTIADLITFTAKNKKIALKSLTNMCGLNINAISNIRNGQKISAESLASIADCLGVSVDYLLGRTDVPDLNRGGASVCSVANSPGSIAGNNSTINNPALKCDSIAAEMLKKFGELSFADKIEIMQAIAEKCKNEGED